MAATATTIIPNRSGAGGGPIDGGGMTTKTSITTTKNNKMMSEEENDDDLLLKTLRERLEESEKENIQLKHRLAGALKRLEDEESRRRKAERQVLDLEQQLQQQQKQSSSRSSKVSWNPFGGNSKKKKKQLRSDSNITNGTGGTSTGSLPLIEVNTAQLLRHPAAPPPPPAAAVPAAVVPKRTVSAPDQSAPAAPAPAPAPAQQQRSKKTGGTSSKKVSIKQPPASSKKKNSSAGGQPRMDFSFIDYELLEQAAKQAAMQKKLKEEKKLQKKLLKEKERDLKKKARDNGSLHSNHSGSNASSAGNKNKNMLIKRNSSALSTSASIATNQSCYGDGRYSACGTDYHSSIEDPSEANAMQTLMNRLELEIEVRTQELEIANKNLEAANQRLQEQSAAQLEQFACMSHEIRTPLNCIIGMASLIMESGDFTPGESEHAESMRMIVSSGELLAAIVNDVLDYFKLASDNVEMDIRRQELQHTLQTVVDGISSGAKERKLQVITNYSPNLPHDLITDSRRLQQILYNLLGNAVKFSKEGGIVEFDVSCYNSYNNKKMVEGEEGKTPQDNNDNINKNNVLRFSVKDYGKGIARDKMDKIFEPFKQETAETEKLHGGTGLGLAITSKLVKALGGTIKVDSEVGKWAEFIVEFENQSHDDANSNSNMKWDYDTKSTTTTTTTTTKITTTSQTSIPPPSVSTTDVVQHQQDNDCCNDKNDSTTTTTSRSHHHPVGALMREASVDTSITCTESSTASSTSFSNPASTNEEELEEAATAVVAATTTPNTPLFPLCATTTNTTQQTKPEASTSTTTTTTSAAAAASVSSSIIPSYDKMRVLVAEDNLVNQKILRKMLDRLGLLEIEIVDNGKKAVESAKNKHFDLIFMDMQMPVMDGLEATQLIRAATSAKAATGPIKAPQQQNQEDEINTNTNISLSSSTEEQSQQQQQQQQQQKHQTPHIVFLTAHAFDQFQDAAFSAGADAFISKPFNLQKIRGLFESLAIQK